MLFRSVGGFVSFSLVVEFRKKVTQGALAQLWLERKIVNLEVAGSIPVGSAFVHRGVG